MNSGMTQIFSVCLRTCFVGNHTVKNILQKETIGIIQRLYCWYIFAKARTVGIPNNKTFGQ